MPDISPQPKAPFAFKMPRPPGSPVGQYSVAILSVVAALMVRMALNPVLHSRGPFIIMFPAVVVAAWSGGWRPGLLAVVLGTLASVALFVLPYIPLRGMELSNQLTLGIFVLNGIGISALAESQHRGRRRMLSANESLRASEQQVRFLSEASLLLASSLDYNTTLQRVAKLAVPHFADWCVVDMLDENGVLQRLVAAHVDAAKEQRSREAHSRYASNPDTPAGPYHVARTGQPEMVADITDQLLRATARDEEHYRLLKDVGLKSYICVPLIAREQIMGVITLVLTETSRRYEDGNLALAQELARRASLAVDNARLYEAAQQEIARRTDAEQALLQNKVYIETLNARLSRSMAETHHRVKNNLQVITALADMQTMQGQETVPASALDRIRMHVRALAGIHDLLTKAVRSDADTDVISSRDTLNKLLATLEGVIGVRSIHADVQDAALPTRQAGALTVLVNEIISNAVKHGGGDIELKFSVTDARGYLEVSDNGPGFPPNFDPQKAANTGLDLIESMACWDLRGDIAYTNRSEGGARVVVTFPVLEETTPENG